MLLLSFTKIAVSVLFLRLKANCLLKNCAVYSRIYIEFQLLHFLGTNTSVKFVVKIARLFRGQIDPLIMFGWDILNFIVGLVQWRGLAQTLVSLRKFSLRVLLAADKPFFCVCVLFHY